MLSLVVAALIAVAAAIPVAYRTGLWPATAGNRGRAGEPRHQGGPVQFQVRELGIVPTEIQHRFGRFGIVEVVDLAQRTFIGFLLRRMKRRIANSECKTVFTRNDIFKYKS